MRTAFLVDGAFFVLRIKKLAQAPTPERAARLLTALCYQHLRHEGRSRNHLYRIFFYDCAPYLQKAHHPLSKRGINFATTELARWRTEFHDQLRRMRKLAVRLGKLSYAGWRIRPDRQKALLAREIEVAQLTEDDVIPEFRQKAVDMRIGLDIASMAFKKQVDQIVLFSGDSDFVPAAKLARREGIDFILDPMWSNVSPDLLEHVDGVHSVLKKPTNAPSTPLLNPPFAEPS